MPKAMKIRKDDTVLVTGGKDRGKTGKVLRTEPRKQRVFVEGLNKVRVRSRTRRRGARPAASSRRRGRSTSPT
jgi:large subunit ribosomal protein L24